VTPQELIDSQVAPCFGRGHVWRETTLWGCERCNGAHQGFACDVCSRVVDAIHDENLFAAIVEIGRYLPEENSENDT
jgi:hypothetical protein